MSCLEALKTAPPPTPGKFAASRPPIINPAWAIPAWYLNASTGSDDNSCVSAGSPCKTCGEIEARWQTNAPKLTNAVLIDFQTSTTERCAFYHETQEGGALYLQGEWTAVDSGHTLSGWTAKSTSAADGRAQVTLNATAGTALANPRGLFIVNTTRANSVAPVLAVTSGTTVRIGQPFDSNLPVPPNPPNFIPNEHNDWANGDSYTLMREPSAQFTSIAPVSPATNSSLIFVFTYASHLYVPDPQFGATASVGETVLFTNNNVSWTESWTDDYLQYGTNEFGTDTQGMNSVFAGGVGPNFGVFVGGAIGCPVSISFSPFLNSALEDDLSLEMSANFYGGQSALGAVTVNNKTIDVLDGTVNLGPLGDSGQLYGTYTLRNDNASNIGYTAQNNFSGTPTILMEGLTVANAIDWSMDPAPWIPNITLTPANLVQTIALGGFGGIAYGYGGGTIQPITPFSVPATTPYLKAGTGISLSGGPPGAAWTISATGGGVTSVTGTAPIVVSPTTGAAVVSLTTPLGAQYGGDGTVSPQAHATPVAEGASPFNFVTAGAAGKLYQSQGVFSDPAWSPFTLASPGGINNCACSDGSNNWISSPPLPKVSENTNAAAITSTLATITSIPLTVAAGQTARLDGWSWIDNTDACGYTVLMTINGVNVGTTFVVGAGNPANGNGMMTMSGALFDTTVGSNTYTLQMAWTAQQNGGAGCNNFNPTTPRTTLRGYLSQ